MIFSVVFEVFSHSFTVTEQNQMYHSNGTKTHTHTHFMQLHFCLTAHMTERQKQHQNHVRQRRESEKQKQRFRLCDGTFYLPVYPLNFSTELRTVQWKGPNVSFKREQNTHTETRSIIILCWSSTILTANTEVATDPNKHKSHKDEKKMCLFHNMSTKNHNLVFWFKAKLGRLMLSNKFYCRKERTVSKEQLYYTLSVFFIAFED